MSHPQATTRIVPLEEVSEMIPTLVQWFVDEWEPYYGATGPGDALADLEASRDNSTLPIAVVALDDDGNPIGTASLRPHSIGSHRHLGPWLAAVLVKPDLRKQGLAKELTMAIAAVAGRMGFDAIYTESQGPSSLLEDWQALDEKTLSWRGPLTVYRREISKD